MSLYVIASILIVISALFGYLNVRFLKLPNTIGLMVITILFTLVVLASSFIDTTLLEQEKLLISQIDFKTVLLDVMLSFLLFAGALHTNFQQLQIQRKPILAFATFSTLTSTFIVGIFTYFILKIVNLEVDFIYCLLFLTLDQSLYFGPPSYVDIERSFGTPSLCSVL